MIVRIMGEGQVQIGPEELPGLNKLDDSLESAIETGDEQAFRDALSALLASVRSVGTPLAADSLEPSDLVLPPADAAMDEVKAMLGDEGLIPD
ncbi:PspA-associated protein PspAA [Actinocorallia longicatena]|uniref:PspA-associated domain-containing protein n=1 Tax=Actinocorallia longicatena TaxID=111803 RepID=A0ABP6QB75_9ACTN